LLARKGVSRTSDDIVHFKTIIDDLSLTVQKENFYFDTHYLFHHIYSAYYFAVNDFENCLIHLKTNLEYFEKNFVNLENQPNIYFSILTNAIFVSEKLGKCKEANNLLEKLKMLPSKVNMDSNEDMQIKLFSSVSSIEMSMLTKRGDFEKAKDLISKIESGLLKYGDKISPSRKAFLEFKIAVVYLSLNEFSNALKWINIILNDKQLDEKEDIVSFAQLLDLLVYIEMKNIDILPYALKNTNRFLKSRNRLFAFEKVFLHFISKAIKSKDVFELETLWEEIYNELSKIQDDSFESVVLEYFDFLSWAEAKFKRKSFKDVVFEKFNQNFSVEFSTQI
jgi:hypothetical protein